MSWIDSHAHLYLDDFDKDREEVFARCDQKDVGEIIMPNIDHTSIDSMLELEGKYPKRCYPTIGLHPCSVKRNMEKELYIVEQWLSQRQFVAIGEIGTDLHWDKTFWPQQQEAFKIQLEWARKHQIPVIIHCRESMDETIALVEEFGEGIQGVFHCFSGTQEQATRIIALGFYLGIGGVATFKNGGLDEVLPEIDLSHLLVETDCPYLAPKPHRGKRNEPSYIPLIGDRIAEIKKVSLDEVKKITRANTTSLFKL